MHGRAVVAELGGVQLPRVTMLETEYLRAVTQAELDWIDSVLAGLSDGGITWTSIGVLASMVALAAGLVSGLP